MNEFVPFAAMSMTIFTVVSLLRFCAGRKWGEAGTIVAVWVSGAVVLWVFAQSSIAGSISGELTGGVPLADLDVWSIIILGLQAGSAATAFNEIRGAIDRDGHTAKPHLFTGDNDGV